MPHLKLFRLLGSRARSLSSESIHTNQAVIDRFAEEVERLCKEFMPYGSGFDSGTEFDLDRSNASRLVFTTAFHHMNNMGMYDGWTQHTVTVVSEFDGLNIKVRGRNRNDINEYIGETFYSALHQLIEVEWNRETGENSFKSSTEERES